jgi:GNAT superfamily N-acetyltransferase
LSSAIDIRRLAPDDWMVFRDVRLAALREAPYAFGSTLHREARASDDSWRERLEKRAQFVARLDGVIVGTAGGFAEDEATAELISMWVAPSARGQGAGDALVDAVVGWAGEQRFGAVRLWVADGNDHAERLYARHGFERTGVVKAIHPDEARMEFEMKMGLTPPRVPRLTP